MEASVGLSSPPKPSGRTINRPHYKAMWQAEKKRADDLLAILNPPRFVTAPITHRITEPVMPEPKRLFHWRRYLLVALIGVAIIIWLA